MVCDRKIRHVQLNGETWFYLQIPWWQKGLTLGGVTSCPAGRCGLWRGGFTRWLCGRGSGTRRGRQ